MSGEKRIGNQLARVAHRTKTDTSIPPSERNDRWLTPLGIVEALGLFDLDPGDFDAEKLLASGLPGVAFDLRVGDTNT